MPIGRVCLVTQGPTERESAARLRGEHWAALYDQYSVDVWRYVARIVGSDVDAVGDAVQEDFSGRGERLPSIRSPTGNALGLACGNRSSAGGVALASSRARTHPTGRFNGGNCSGGRRTVRAGSTRSKRRKRCGACLPRCRRKSSAILQGKYCDAQSIAQLVDQLGGTTEGIRSKLARARRDFKRRYQSPGQQPARRQPVENIDVEES